MKTLFIGMRVAYEESLSQWLTSGLVIHFSVFKELGNLLIRSVMNPNQGSILSDRTSSGEGEQVYK